MNQILIICLICLTSCSSVKQFFSIKSENTFPYKEKIRDELYYLLTDNEKRELYNCQNDLEVIDFYNRFWLKRDPTPATSANENKKIYYERLRYVTDNFSELTEGWRTDRGRVLLIYGFPDQIIPGNFSNIDIGLQKISHFEIWVYNTPSQYIGNQHIFSNIERGKTKFVFADIYGMGIFKQVFSTEPGERIDPRIYFSLLIKILQIPYLKPPESNSSKNTRKYY